MRLFFFLLLFSFQSLFAQSVPGTFSQINTQGGGWQTGFAQHPEGRLYCRTDVGGVYRSDDFGDSWSFLSSNFTTIAPLLVHGLAVSPVDADVVLFGGGTSYTANDPNRGIWKSTDGGSTWRHVLRNINFSGNDVERHGGEALCFHPDVETELFAATRGEGIYRSTDTGESWTKIGGDTFDGINLAGIFVHSSYPDQVFAYGSGGCWLSLDRGQTFTILYASDLAYRVARKSDGTLFCSDNDQVWRYTASDWNDPATWTRTSILQADNPISAITVLANETVFISSFFSELNITDDDGDSFTRLPETLIGEVPNWHIAPGQIPRADELGVGYTQLLQDATNPSRFFLTGGYGISRSSNSGQSWEYITNGINEVVCWKVQFHPTDPEKILIPMADHALAVLPNQSESLLATNYNARHFAFPSDIVNFAHTAFASGSRIIAPGAEAFGQNVRIYISNDDGISWEAMDFEGLPEGTFNPVVSGVVATDNPDEFLLMLGGLWGDGLGGVYRTTDAGQHFTQVSLPPEATVNSDGSPYSGGSEFTWFNDVYNDGEGTDTRYIIQRFKRILRSTDRGQNWQTISPTGLSGSALFFDGLLSPDPAQSGRLWLGATNGLWTSTDAGESFREVGGFDFVNPDVRFDALDGRIVLCGRRPGDTFNKIYYSPNNGVDWGEVTRDDFRFPDMRGVSLDPYRPGTIWIATGSQSVLRFTPNVINFSNSSVQDKVASFTLPNTIMPPRILTSKDLATPFQYQPELNVNENNVLTIDINEFGNAHFFRAEP